ncbi:putative bem46 family protein [Neofusicoccum parvum]|uniref:Bem46 family protein n=2 Tax=Neofusicoccum parvum TaxID=310453 RepID=A0ACB5RZX4_9PEZI|nr:putative bem46 family protein [Neofusicoccum parvum UCRNP2]GME26107.1 putative bem46 family protein [Neofusicoccum parvum]GME65085.1 putative bem46 family protein [Neofusicoccum parvum]
MDSVISYLRIPLLASTGIATVLSGVLYFKQNDIIYPRNLPPGARTDVPRPTQFGISDFEELMIPTPDGESLSAFFIRPANKQHARNVTFLMFHGNAGNIGYRLPIAKILEEELGCNILMLQYRGYGLSTGTPNEKGLAIDAQTGLDYIRQRAELRGTKIVLYGQSLGGAVSIGLAAKNQEQGDIAGVVLENTFLSIRKLIPSEEVMPKIKQFPILFLSGLRDEIVPPSHMAKLFDLCVSKAKVWREFPNGSHNDTVAEPLYFEYIEDFLRSHVLRKPNSEKPSPEKTALSKD